MQATQTSIEVAESERVVSGLWQHTAECTSVLVLGHGAGAGMQHPFMQQIAQTLSERSIATLRYQFPYMEIGRRTPDPRRVLLATVHAAVARARGLAPGLPLFAGGKSMGGRMTSLALADQCDPDVAGIVFLGFPLHNAGKHGNDRADHLFALDTPLLFLQGTRDKLADLSYLYPVCDRLGEQAHLHIVEGGDHSFDMLKRSGRSAAEVFDELGDTIQQWTHTQTAQ